MSVFGDFMVSQAVKSDDEIKRLQARVEALSAALRDFEHFGFLSDGHCYFCDARVDEADKTVIHYSDCIWRAARKLLEKGSKSAPTS